MLYKQEHIELGVSTIRDLYILFTYFLSFYCMNLNIIIFKFNFFRLRIMSVNQESQKFRMMAPIPSLPVNLNKPPASLL
jgi:hypothetical protein